MAVTATLDIAENEAVNAYDAVNAYEADTALLAVPCNDAVAVPNKYEELIDDEAHEADITDPDAAI